MMRNELADLSAAMRDAATQLAARDAEIARLRAALLGYQMTFMHGASDEGPWQAHVTKAMFEAGRAALNAAGETT